MSMLIDKETIFINTACLAEHLHYVIPALKHSIFQQPHPKDTEEAISRHLAVGGPEKIEDRFKNMLLPAAYSKKTLGIYRSPEEKPEVTHESLKAFVSQYFTADRLTIAAAGVKTHEAFVELVKPSFSSIPMGSTRDETSAYTGGVLSEELEGEMVHFTIGFQGASFFDKEMPALVVLKTIIGEGGGFSTGGPGKGMHSRAYTTLLPYGFIESVKAVNHNFMDSGVFAISFVALQKYAEYIPDITLKELISLMEVTEEELNRAKNIITRDSLINSQKTQSRIEDIAKNCAYFFQTPEEFAYLKKVNAVTLADIKVALIKLLRSKFTLNTIATKGTKIPSIEQMYGKLGR